MRPVTDHSCRSRRDRPLFCRPLPGRHQGKDKDEDKGIGPSQTLALPSLKSTFSQPLREKCVSKLVIIGSKVMFHPNNAMKSHVLHTVWCNFSGEAAWEIDRSWEWKGYRYNWEWFLMFSTARQYRPHRYQSHQRDDEPWTFHRRTPKERFVKFRHGVIKARSTLTPIHCATH